MRLYAKYLAFIFAVIGFSLWASIHFSRQAVTDAISAQISAAAAADAAKNLADIRQALAAGRETGGLKVLHAFQQRSGAVYAGLASADRRLIAHTNVALAGTRADTGWAAGALPEAPAYRRSVYRGEELVEVVVPVIPGAGSSGESLLLDEGPGAGGAEGFLLAGLSLKTARRAEKAIVGRLLGRTSLILLAGLAVSFFFIRHVLRQVESLSEGIRKVRQGDLSWRVPVSARDEVGDLGVFFNEMLTAMKADRETIDAYKEHLEHKVLERTLELEQSQARLLQASKMAAVGELVSGVAHELNNPLAGIRGFAQLMKKDGGLSAQQQNDLDVIILQSGRAKEIIQSLLQFSRKTEPKKQTVSLPELVEDAARLITYEFSSSGIELIRELPENLPPVLGDRAQLQQVFLNIMSNARDAMAHDYGGRLRITGARKDHTVTLQFTDTGPGIGEEHLSRIFDPFFTTKPAGKGTGLGLSISYEIIRNHNGNLSAQNGPGRGATLILELPVKDENTQDTAG